MTHKMPTGKDSYSSHNEVDATAISTVIQSGTIAGGVHVHAMQEERPVPHQLPAMPRYFTGRTNELARLDHALEQAADSAATMVISAIGGVGGIGKTWLALYWAHRHVDQFPDGQLHVDLHGFGPRGIPVPSAVAVRCFLDSLGVAPAAIPKEAESQAALYRSLVANKKMLILLDNAADAAQVEPLLPGSPTCTVLVTSRNPLLGLIAGHSAQHLRIDVLNKVEAYALLAARLGPERLGAEPAATNELIACCDGFPLALGIVAGRAHIQPQASLASFAAELRNHRLDALDDNDSTVSLPMVLSWSYRSLTDEEARTFGLLGIAPGPDIDLKAAASLLALPVRETKAMLRALEYVSLVSTTTLGRYHMHDLVRLYAAERARESDRATALRRALDFYLHTAHEADRHLEPHRPTIHLDSPTTEAIHRRCMAQIQRWPGLTSNTPACSPPSG